MAKVKKHANGGSYYVTVKEPLKPAQAGGVPKATAPIVGWNIDPSQIPTKK